MFSLLMNVSHIMIVDKDVGCFTDLKLLMHGNPNLFSLKLCFYIRYFLGKLTF